MSHSEVKKKIEGIWSKLWIKNKSTAKRNVLKIIFKVFNVVNTI